MSYFNPHSRKGSDVIHLALITGGYRFQSTLPQGEWPHDSKNNRFITGISIHTPARGVTFLAIRFCKPHEISIHTPARGVTLLNPTYYGIIKISIHTPARGVTAKLHDFYLKTKYFYQFYLICFWCYSYFYRILKRFNLCKQIFRCESLSVFLNT